MKAEAEKAEGLTIIIDIFRAATLSTFLVNQGIERIIPVAKVEDALAIKNKNKRYLLLGEEKGLKIFSFDYGNSPSEIKNINFTGKTAVHRTERGTNGIVLAKKASEIIFGSFVAANALSDYIIIKNPEVVSIVAMDGPGSEDDVFAQYLLGLLENKKIYNQKQLRNLLRKHYSSERFLNPQKPEFPEEDFFLCTEIDRFNLFPILKGKYLYSNG